MIEEIYKWLDEKYPEGAIWTSSEFGCYRDAPVEIRMILSMHQLESEVANGGLPQFLWNTYYHWRKVLEDCKTGCEFIGAFEQKNAVAEFWYLCEQHEAECFKFIQSCIRDNDFSYFGKWCEHSAAALKSGRESLFWTDSGLEEKRIGWLNENRERELSLMVN